MRCLLFVTSISFLLAQGACSKSKTETETPTAATEPVAEPATPAETESPVEPATTEAGGGEEMFPNLKVLPKTFTEDQLKSTMKSISSSLGVQCDHCHDVENWAQETEMKGKARSMLEMTMSLDKEYFGGKMRLRCMTCHQGKTEPNVD